MEAKWYTVKVQPNRERSIADRVKIEMEKAGTYVNPLVPMEKVYFAKNGKKAHREKVIYPGYIFIESDNFSVLQEVLKYIPGNTGILRSKTGEPSLLKKSEVDKMIADNESKASVDLNAFTVGEIVSIIGGPFDKFKGTIEEVNKEKNKVKVNVLIFGRPTPVDLQMDQVQKVID
jgi:transcriptional antiterminator NusG